MKLLSKSVMALALGLTFIAASSSVAFAHDKHNVTLTPQQLSNQQLVDALVWYQTSAEFRAISYQSFNFARYCFDNAKVPAGDVKAVIVDLDETMINNSAYEAALVKYNGAFDFNGTWISWVRSEESTALPGSVAFANYVNSHGGKMYYISNRGDANKKYTMELLKKLGYPGVTDQTVLLRSNTTNKNIRFQQVEALPDTKVVLWMGDNLYDFPNAYQNQTQASRYQFVNDNKDNFGVKFIILPNPMYGSWMSALHPHYFKLSVAKQNKVKLDSIQPWYGYKEAIKYEKKDK